MVYTLDKADQRCDVTYVDWSKKYSPIPKATCEMIQPKCSSGGGGSYDDSVELKCEDLKKLIHGEDKPKEDKQKEDTPKEDKPQENKPKEDEKPKEEETPRENGTPREENPSDNVGGNTTEDKEKPSTDEVTPKENEPSPSPRVDENPTEPTPEPPIADTPREDTPEVNLLELMPRIEDKFSKVYFNKDTVTSVGEDSPEEKVAFENRIITKLKGKLPEGTLVEAVLSEPFFKEGSEFVTDKTNYTLHVRVTLKGKVYEQEYNVPHEAFAVVIDSI